MTTRRLGRWRLLFDKDFRHAVRKAKMIESGEIKLQTVDYTDGGLAITMPAEAADEWNDLPVEVREQFMRDLDAQAQAGGLADPSDTHDWKS